MKKQALLRRAAIAATVGGLFLTGLATAQSASAEDWKPTLVSGTEVTATVATANQTLAYPLPAEKGEHLTIATSTSTWSNNGSAKMSLYVPNAAGTQYIFYKQWTVANGVSAFMDVTPEANGLWKLTVTPVGSTTGSTKFTYSTDAFAAEAADTKVPPTPKWNLEAWKSYKMANKLPGQNAVSYFHAEAGTHLSLDVTASSWGTGTAAGLLYDPSGVLAEIIPLAATPTYREVNADATGYWKFVVDPQGAAVGSATLTVAPDAYLGLLDTNVGKTADLKSKGQDAIARLYGVAGDDLPVKVSGKTWSAGGVVKLWFYAPGATHAYDRCDLTTADQVCTFNPNQTGAWKIVMDPQGAATAKATLTRLT